MRSVRRRGQAAEPPVLVRNPEMRCGRGQVVVEVLLILPVFLFLVFTIMEIGHLGFRTLLLHHAAYEVARVGSLSSTERTPCQPGSAPTLDQGKMQSVAARILANAQVSAETRETLVDPQSECTSHDVEVTLREQVPLVFPLTGLVLGSPRGSRSRQVVATVRMPVERPLFK